MRKNLFTLILLCSAFAINAQTSVGLIAHWDMNGTTNDVSGNGHNGNGNNLIPAAGADGVMGHAWAFNGVNSYITIPYSPALNVSGYTISATIKVEGFYSGPCHSNEIFCRGTTHGGSFGTYFLDFTDWPAGYGCTTSTVDSALESFMPAACGSGTCFDPVSVS